MGRTTCRPAAARRAHDVPVLEARVRQHLQQEALGVQQEAGMAGGRNALAEVVCGGVGGALGLMQALGVCGAGPPQGSGCRYGAAVSCLSEEPSQLPLWQRLAAQPQRLVAACCDVWGHLATAAAAGTMRSHCVHGRSVGEAVVAAKQRPQACCRFCCRLLQAVDYTGVHARSSGHKPPTAAVPP